MIKTAYIRRKEARERLFSLKQRIIFGMLVGWLLVIFGAINFFFTVDANDVLWASLSFLGIAFILMAVIYPDIYALPSRGLFKVGNFLFGWLFKIVLAAIYFVFILPTSLIMKAFKPGIDILSWDGALEGLSSNWKDKIIPIEISGTVNDRQGKRGLFHGFYGVMAYFVRQGHFALLPVILLMILLGLMLLFLQTSVIAPMIYTLF